MPAKFIQQKHGAVIQGGSLKEIQDFRKQFNIDFPEHCYKFSNYGVSSDGTHIAVYYADCHNKEQEE